MTKELDAALKAVRDMPDAPDAALKRQTCILCDNPAASVHTTPNGMAFSACSLHRPESHIPFRDVANDDARVEAIANICWDKLLDPLAKGNLLPNAYWHFARDIIAADPATSRIRALDGLLRDAMALINAIIPGLDFPIRKAVDQPYKQLLARAKEMGIK